MNTDSRNWLVSLLKGSAQPVGDAATQAHAVLTASVVCRLDGFSLLRVSGEDALTFLQGQLSNDVRALDAGRAQFSSYSTAKGRVLASLLLWRNGDDYFLLLSADIAAAIGKRLSMYVLRSKVRIEVAEPLQLTGAHGPAVEAWLAGLALWPAQPLDVCGSADGVMTVALPSGGVILVAQADQASRLATGAGSDFVAVDFCAWSLLDIEAGIPWVSSPTQEQFVAQMLNMDIFGALSFSKGCYPGQEIIARTRYLGKVKRRMYRVQLPFKADIGAPLYSPETADQSIGMVVNVALDDSGCWRALVVVQSVAWERGVYLDVGFEQKLENLSLPYALIDE
jgi:hypothetical protein